MSEKVNKKWKKGASSGKASDPFFPLSWSLEQATNNLKMVWILHEEKERKVENLRQLEVMQPKILSKTVSCLFKNKYEIPVCE